jgi:hypothetical protein
MASECSVSEHSIIGSGHPRTVSPVIAGGMRTGWRPTRAVTPIAGDTGREDPDATDTKRHFILGCPSGGEPSGSAGR